MTDREAQAGLPIYFGRMKIEQSFRDLKDLLRLTKLIPRRDLNPSKIGAGLM